MRIVIGMDEVGRGAWAGPLVVGAVALGEPIVGLTDSKKLSKKKRETLATEIKNKALFCGLGWVSPSEVDDLGLTEATGLACYRALEGVPMYDEILIDGNINYLPKLKNVKLVVDGDFLEPCISAGSILAKVSRDAFMAQQHNIFPEYGFISNVGYGTAAHMAAIRKSGLTPIHRWSYKPFRDYLDNYET